MSLILNYPHRRVGTLPLTKKTRTFFPSSGTQPTMIKFVGSRTKEEFPGWIVPSGRFVFGLDQWFPKNEIPVGAYIKLERTDDPHRIVIDYEKRRPMREWIRTAAVEGNHLVFKMEKRLIPCEYDDLMIIGEADPISIDTLWVKSQEQHKPLFDHIIQIFPELSKLNPQSTVHAKTLYSALNVIRRTTPGEMIMELSDHECFIPMGNGYWTYDPSMKG